MDGVVVGDRRSADLDASVAALRLTYEVDGYPMNWPADPHAWLSPPRLLGAWVARRVERSGSPAVERSHEEIAGHVVLHGDDAEAEVSRLFVSPAARRRSVASVLVDRAAEWASERGIRLTLSVTDERRSSAIAFYEAGGWQHTHSSWADWLSPEGGRVRLRHYALSPRNR